MKALLQAVKVSKAFPVPGVGNVEILHDVSLELHKGEFASIMGRSGSGKSTLLNIFGTLDEPTDGHVLFQGARLDRLSARRRARLRGEEIGFIFQQFNLLDRYTALENVMAPFDHSHMRQFRARRKVASEMLSLVGMSHRLSSLPGQLSGGEQQRVAIARSLVREPSLVLADEPTGALDPETAEEVLGVLVEAVRAGDSALILVTHDAGLASAADRRFCISDGRLIDTQSTATNASAALDRPPGTEPQSLSSHPIKFGSNVR